MTIAIIGAGLAGLACADKLAAAGRAVTLFDKGRGPGGRMSTRRRETADGVACWDHGAQFFTARTPDFQTVVANWGACGVVAAWRGRFVTIDADDQRLNVAVLVDFVEEFDEVLAMRPDAILLDNMELELMTECVRRARGSGVVIEASGNISLGNVRAVADTGVDVISVGALTHSAPAVDLSQLIESHVT